MVLELGPCPAEDMLRWAKFARRIVVEMRSNAEFDEVPPDVLDLWARTLDEWLNRAAHLRNEESPFRWTSELEPEVVEFLLHGLDRCLHSPTVMSWVTPEEADQQRSVTMHVVEAFADSLSTEGPGCRQYADQILTSLGPLLQR